MNKREMGKDNLEAALMFINRFGWLRATELRKLLWPKSRHSAKNCSKLLVRLRLEKLIIEKPLPDGYGQAILLSAAGAKAVSTDDFKAKSGKDWGSGDGENWRPPHTWKHDLLTAGLLAGLRLPFHTERDLAKNQGVEKCADGVLLINGNHVWLEVENARKSGSRYTRKGYQPQSGHLARMAKQLILAARGFKLGDIEIKHAAVAYDPGAKCERGYRIDHRARIIAAIGKQIRAPIMIFFRPDVCRRRHSGQCAIGTGGDRTEVQLKGSVLDNRDCKRKVKDADQKKTGEQNRPPLAPFAIQFTT